MIHPAYLHKVALIPAYAKAIHEPRAKFFSTRSYRTHELQVDASEWSNLQYVSMDSAGKMLGYLAAVLDREARTVNELNILSFQPRSIVFTRDVAAFFLLLIEQQWERIGWSMVVGNPVENAYAMVVDKLGGRVVGVQHRRCRGSDGCMRSRQLYEVLPGNVDEDGLMWLRQIARSE